VIARPPWEAADANLFAITHSFRTDRGLACDPCDRRSGGWATPAGANKIKATILDIGPVPYAPGATSDVARILITGAYNGNSLDTKNSALTIDRNGQEIIVPVAASVSSQPGGGMAAMKPGFISFGAAGSAKFQPGDTLTFNLIFNGNVAVKTSGGLYLDTDNMNTPPRPAR
jgi:hypothetical protein